MICDYCELYYFYNIVQFNVKFSYQRKWLNYSQVEKVTFSVCIYVSGNLFFAMPNLRVRLKELMRSKSLEMIRIKKQN